MEAANPTADTAREPARHGTPSWVLGLVPLLLIIAAVGVVFRARRARPR